MPAKRAPFRGQAALAEDQLAELDLPGAFDEAAAHLSPADVTKSVGVSCSAEQHFDWLRGDADVGFDRLFLNNVQRGQAAFLATFGKQVLAHFRAG